MVKYIVTHPGSAHRDEVIAVSLAFAHEGICAVYRREPTPEELADPTVLVLDVGMRHEPELSNFDHHQRGRDEKPECAMSLYAQDKGLESVLSYRKWYEPTIQLDVTGPFATAKALGLPRFPFELSGPLEGQLIQMFEDTEFLHPEDLLAKMLYLIGLGILKSAREYVQIMENLAKDVKVANVNGTTVLIANTSDTTGLQDLRDRDYPAAAVCCSWDDRGAGWSLYRFNDHPAVNFSMLEGNPRIVFAHKGGFIAKTHERLELDDVLDLVRQALV